MLSSCQTFHPKFIVAVARTNCLNFALLYARQIPPRVTRTKLISDLNANQPWSLFTVAKRA